MLFPSPYTQALQSEVGDNKRNKSFPMELNKVTKLEKSPIYPHLSPRLGGVGGGGLGISID